MLYRQMRISCPPPFFALQVKSILDRLGAKSKLALPPAHMMRSLRFYIESMLLAENLPPRPACVLTLLERFSQILARTSDGKPVLHRRPTTLALMFDVFSVQSEMNIDDPDELMLAYTQSMMGFLLFKSAPAAIGMVGLGGGSLVKFCYRHLPAASIAVAEIDPLVIALRDDFCIPGDDHRLQVVCQDGAQFVRQADGRYDVLLIDGFDNKGQPPQLCSQRFYQDCWEALAPDGVLVVNLLGGDAWETKIYMDRMRHSFDGNLIVIQALDSLNLIAYAWKGEMPDLERDGLQRRMMQLKCLHPVILRATAQRILAEYKAIALPPQRVPAARRG